MIIVAVAVGAKLQLEPFIQSSVFKSGHIEESTGYVQLYQQVQQALICNLEFARSQPELMNMYPNITRCVGFNSNSRIPCQLLFIKPDYNGGCNPGYIQVGGGREPDGTPLKFKYYKKVVELLRDAGYKVQYHIINPQSTDYSTGVDNVEPGESVDYINIRL